MTFSEGDIAYPPEPRKPASMRGPRPFRKEPTARERVMSTSLATFVTRETGIDVTADQTRAFMWAFNKWKESREGYEIRNPNSVW
jgi:hypothetical protein